MTRGRHWQRRELAAAGMRAFEPTDQQREIVRLLKFNGSSEARIAACINVTLDELRYYFVHELEYTKDEVLAAAAGRVIQLAKQDEDRGVALRASLHMLQARNRLWRIPKDLEDHESGTGGPRKAISKMTLDEVEKELERLREQEAADRAAGAAGDPAADAD